MRYVPLFGLSVRHPYYSDQICPDSRFEPTAETERLARNHRMTLRVRPDGVVVVGSVDDGGDLLIALPAGAAFTFHMRLRNADFALFTDMAAIDDLRSQIAEQRATRRDELLESGTFVVPYFVTGGGDTLSPAVRETADKPPSGLFATAEVTYTAASPAADGYRDFRIEFAPNSARWSYYCITDLTPADLSIADASSSGPLTFGAARDLAANPDAADPVAGQLAAMHPDLRRLRFDTSAPVASRKEPRDKLELRLDGERVSGPLPNPKLSASSTVTVGASQTEASRYHVVKYPTRPSASTGG